MGYLASLQGLANPIFRKDINTWYFILFQESIPNWYRKRVLHRNFLHPTIV